MKLTRLSYKDANWQLENLQLSELNLLVGKNATGKSRTLKTIVKLRLFLTQKVSLELTTEKQKTDWKISFLNKEGESIDYKFGTGTLDEGIVYEEIVYNQEVVLSRNKKQSSDTAIIKNQLSSQEETIYPPNNKLVIHTTRDVKKFPFLEGIMDWAEQAHEVQFGSIHPLSTIDRYKGNIVAALGEIPTLFENLSDKGKQNILVGLSKLGYNVREIGIDNYGEGVNILYLKEEDVKEKLLHFDISQGMYRALVILILFQEILEKKQLATILIDDLCEGLDYERATKLGKLLFKTALENNIQLIATSNDSFLMDVVDLKYWNVLIREGSTVHGINAHSHPEIFEDFKFTGLSNFDFFSSSYLKSALK